MSLFGVLNSCKHEPHTEYLGMQYKPVPADFQITTPLASSRGANVNLHAGDYTSEYTAAFSHEVSWFLTITGTQSGAVKRYSGLSSQITSTEAKWDGGSSNHIFFRKDENIVIELSFLGTDLKQTLNQKLTRTKRYEGLVKNGVKYTVVDDFEEAVANAGGEDIPTDRPFSGSYKDLQDSDHVVGAVSHQKVQGNFSMLMTGRDVNSNTYISGSDQRELMKGLLPKNPPSNANSTVITETDPSKVFFNMYIYGSGKPNTTVQIKTHEVDNMENINLNTYAFDPVKDDGYLGDFPVTWTGWRLISVPYSAFKRANDPLNGGGGNGKHEPHKIAGLSLLVSSLPKEGSHVEAFIDFITITQGGPFEP